MQVDNDTTIVVEDGVTRVLHQEPSTPFATGGFDSPVMASPEARSDQVRGSAQDRGVGAGMLSPQRESSSQKADLGALGGGAHGLQALAQSVIAGKTGQR